jgi:hypothetical protein
VELFEGERLGLPIGSDFALARDMDGDGAVDIVCTNHETVSVAFGAQGGGYGRAVVLPVLAPVSSPYSLNDAIDTDGNGLLDILLPTSNGPWVPSRLALIEQMAPRQFAPLRLLPITDLYEQARAADVDGDGDIDIVAVAAGRAEFHVLLGDGHGAFVRVQAVPAPAGATIKNLAAADLTRDGASEVYLSSGLFTPRGLRVERHTAARSYC